ncbi:MAG: Gfo/Idh/MocA family oxidoreductase [Candidatus Hydrogenedentes bacterium]|nr:Gfo/Idh/MocA family oxidoreductase [Candidatus Hydrogenedentota bacterium]
MPLKVAFVGFRHGHVMGMYNLLKSHADAAIAAACEEDAENRAALKEQGVAITHESYEDMLSSVECDVVAVGDYFAIRGERAIAALEAGKHIVGDKPLCTRLDELDRIETLAYSKHLKVGCMLDLPNLGPYITLRDVIRRGAIGEVHTITFIGIHPLNYGKRPAWYFEPGKHGGTLNDIAIHGIDIIPWLTGRTVAEITAARAWNAKLKQHPEFQDGATLMLKLDNQGCVMGDVSYLSADTTGFKIPAYWRFTITGSGGVVETAVNDTHVRVYRHDSTTPIEEPVAPPNTGGYFADFVRDVAENPDMENLPTARVLHTSRLALLAQAAADTGAFPTPA